MVHISMPPQSRNFRGTGPHACIYYLFNIGADCSETLAFDQFFRKISEELFVHDRLQLRAVIIRNAFEMSLCCIVTAVSSHLMTQHGRPQGLPGVGNEGV